MPIDVLSATETGMNGEHVANDWAPADQSRTTDDEDRLHYAEHQVQLVEDYSGYVLDIPIDELRAWLSEAVKATNVCSSWYWPLPPKGLPGTAVASYRRDDLEAKLLEIGIRYVHAIVNSQGRAMHHRWQDAADFICKIEREAEDRIYLEQARRAMEEAEARDATPVYVYFIGAEDGPIKIGMATNPQSRLRSLQTSHHEKLNLLATCGGGAKQERAYHKRFAAHRLSGEWFARCPDILAEIESLTHTPAENIEQPVSISAKANR